MLCIDTRPMSCLVLYFLGSRLFYIKTMFISGNNISKVLEFGMSVVSYNFPSKSQDVGFLLLTLPRYKYNKVYIQVENMSQVYFNI